jgi:D-aminopeptidase
MLPHTAAAALIKEKARRAMEKLGEIAPYQMQGPVEAKVQFTTRGVRYFQAREGVEQIDERTWAFRGKDLKDAWLKYSSSF